ncbi:VMAP-C domain-containing protein [Streptomyces sp. NPDC002073]
MTDNGTPDPVQPRQEPANLPALRGELMAQLEVAAHSPALDVRALLRLFSRSHAPLVRRVDASATPYQMMIRLVRACAEHPVTADALADAMERLTAPQQPDLVHTLRALSDQMAAARLMNSAELDELRQLTAERSVTDLRRLVEACLPPLSADLPAHCTSAWTTALHLMRRNVSPGDLPPLLAFIEYLAAAQQPPEATKLLRQWAETKAGQWGVIEPLRSCRANALRHAADAPTSSSRIMLVFFPDGLRSDLYTLRTWHHDTETTDNRSMRGEDAQVDFRQIAEAVYDSIKRWARRLTQRTSISVEFWLPLPLVNEPVWEWCTPQNREDRLPNLNVVVRSLDRLQMPVLHGTWRNRWAHLMDTEVHRPVFLHETRTAPLPDGDPVVLSTPPDDDAGRTEFLAALRNGAPAILWHREDCSSPAFRKSVRHLIEEGPLRELPSRVSALRRESLHTSNEEAARGIALLWDDPDRLLPAMPTLVAPGWDDHEPVASVPTLTGPGEAP